MSFGATRPEPTQVASIQRASNVPASSGSLEPESPARSAGVSADRAALLAQLSEQIAAVGPAGAVPIPRSGDRRVGEGDRGDEHGGGASSGRVGSVPGRDDPRPTSRRRSIGELPREIRPAGGHPEDDPGDPAAVARQICLRQLTGAPRTRAQLAQVLRRREIPDDVAEQVLDRLTRVGLIDDEAYAAAFVATKHRDRGLGRSALRTELQRKGVDADTAAAAVTAIDTDAERDRAAALIARRVDSAMNAGPDAARRRLVALLSRRGYSPSLAVAVVDEALTRYADE